MMGVEVHVHINGKRIIFARTVVNTRDEVDGYIVYRCDDGTNILHRPADGAIVLAHKMLDRIQEQT